MENDRPWGTYLERKARRKRQERAIHTSRAANARPSAAPSPPMGALLALAPALGADAAACVALTLRTVRAAAALALQTAVRRLLALRQLERLAGAALCTFVQAHKDEASAALRRIHELPLLQLLPTLRALVL